jgi:amphi-Trp domain-containing protein
MPEELEVEKGYDRAQTAAKLRRLAESLEQGQEFEIQVSGERIYVPADAEIVFEFESDDEENELEIEITWPKR